MKNRAFDIIEPERRKFITDIAEDIKSGKISNPAEIMMRLNSMPKGKNFSYSERQELFKAILLSMDNEERERLLEVLKIAKGI